MEPSVFLDFNLPNAATWLYFSFILTVALFFRFTRFFSIRNLDLVTLFLLAPGLLLLLEAHSFFSYTGSDEAERTRLQLRGLRELTAGYAGLLAGSAYWFVRAILDLALVRRPVISPNLNKTGLAWLGLALFFCLIAVAARRGGEPVVPWQVGQRPIPIGRLQEGATALAKQTQPAEASPDEVRFWVERSLAASCHLAVVLGLFMIGWRHFQDVTTGTALGTLYLLLPYSAYHIAQFHIVWPAAFVTWAVFFYRRPVVSGWLLGLAAGSAFVPLALFPLWTGFYARRGMGRFCGAFLTALLVSTGIMLLALWSDGWLTSGLTLETLSEWVPWKRPHAESLWTDVHWAYRLPIFVVYVAFVVGIAFWPSPKDLSHLIALSAAVLIGVQFWHADRGGVYVLWYLPLLLLMVFRPTLTGHGPPTIEPGGGMLRWAWRRVRPARGASAVSRELAV